MDTRLFVSHLLFLCAMEGAATPCTDIGLIWAENLKRCQVIPGEKCSSTDECVKGSICTGRNSPKCSSCPEPKTLDPGSGECRFKLKGSCDTDTSSNCPSGSECIESICKCSDSSGLELEYDPIINECRHSVPFQPCKNVDHGFAPKCKMGTVCELDRGNEYKCLCDKSMGLIRGSQHSENDTCLILENHPCSLQGGFECKNYNSEQEWTKCQEDKQSGQFKCAKELEERPESSGHLFNGSNVLLGIGLVVIAIAAKNVVEY